MPKTQTNICLCYKIKILIYFHVVFHAYGLTQRNKQISWFLSGPRYKNLFSSLVSAIKDLTKLAFGKESWGSIQVGQFSIAYRAAFDCTRDIFAGSDYGARGSVLSCVGKVRVLLYSGCVTSSIISCWPYDHDCEVNNRPAVKTDS
jgi:hypothetical protein